MRFFALLLLISLSFSAFGQKSDKPWKISKKEFQELAGSNDTSKAMVQLFFHRRNQIWVASAAIFITAAAVGRVDYYEQSQITGEGVYSSGLTILAGFVGAVVVIPLTIKSIIGRFKYSKKGLYKTLNEFERSHTIREPFRRKTLKVLKSQIG